MAPGLPAKTYCRTGHLGNGSPTMELARPMLTFVLAGALTATTCAAPQGLETLYFAAGWQPAVGEPGNVVQVGVLYPCHSGWCSDSVLLDGRANLATTPIAKRHEMHAPVRRPDCSDRPMATVNGQVRTGEPVEVAQKPDGYEISNGLGTYQWRRVSTGTDGRPRLELQSLVEKHSRKPTTQVVGIAFVGPAIINSVSSIDELQGKYDGVINHKDMNSRPEDPWTTRRSIIDFSKFRNNSSDTSVRGYITAGHPDVERRLGKTLWVQHSIALQPRPTPRLGLVLHEYGHDFNGNGCLDEQAHNKIILPVLNNSRVTELLFVEYTPDIRSPRDRIPMLSVGAYFSQRF